MKVWLLLACLGLAGCAGLSKAGQVFADGVGRGVAREPDATIRVEK